MLIVALRPIGRKGKARSLGEVFADLILETGPLVVAFNKREGNYADAVAIQSTLAALGATASEGAP